MRFRFHLAVLSAGALTACGVAAGGFAASAAPGALNCPLAPFSSTDYGIQPGQTVTCTIDGATDVADGPVDVFVKRTGGANITISATASGGVITFTHTAPLDGCDVGPVSYKTSGNKANNDWLDDGLRNDSGNANAGFKYADQNGHPVPCRPTAADFRSVAAVKTVRGVVVRWRTASEVSILGFNVYRQDGAKRTKLNARLVLAAGSLGRSYSWLDRGVANGRYWIQVVRRDGGRALYGPAGAR